MLNTDLLLKNEATTKAKGRKRKADEDDSEASFHFIAFMPVKDQLWKLDGLERQPVCLGIVSLASGQIRSQTKNQMIGAFEDDWLNQAKPDIEARMAQSEECQIEFAILSLVRDPLLDLIPRLADNAKNIASLSARLDALKPDWWEFDMPSHTGESSTVLTAPDSVYGVTQEVFHRATISEETTRLCESEAVEDIITQRQQFVTAQARLRWSIKDEQQSIQSDEERVMARKCDYGARMQNFVRKIKTKRQMLDEVPTV